MKKLKGENKLCLICMEEHEVDTVELMDMEVFKGKEISFQVTYEYCQHADELLETEEMIKANSLAMKDAYRREVGLLTAKEIIAIREKYDVSQKDFSDILNWGRATITRYENHQVQDRAHDDVLRKIDEDPKWFLQMLKRSEGKLSPRAYMKYYVKANGVFCNKKNQYLVDLIHSIYANFEDLETSGFVELNLEKVIEMINYLALHVTSLHKVKLMKMLWYSDALHYKRTQKGISGLVYSALPMGAVPEGYEQIVLLEGVKFEEMIYGENIAYKFIPSEGFEVTVLSHAEIEAMNKVIEAVGKLTTNEIIDKMHDEQAYKCTGSNCMIKYSLSDQLTLE